MSKTVKIVLIVLASLFLLSLAVCGAGYYWLESNMDEFKKEGEKLMTEASEFAKTADQDACVKETLRRSDQCPPDLAGAICRGKLGVFINACIQGASATDGFCKDVPPPTEIMAIAQWSIDRCAAAYNRPNDQECARMITAIAHFCHDKR